MSERYPSAAKEHADLREYATALFAGEAVDEERLAQLVTADPAFQTLNANEWWNVALILAFKVRRGR